MESPKYRKSRKKQTDINVDGPYYCPMKCEGEKVYDEPGSCPKCGMDLVPEKGAETCDEEKACKGMARKFWIAMALSIPVFVIGMSVFLEFLHLDNMASKLVWG
jgi:Cu2+-exporting ATPase